MGAAGVKYKQIPYPGGHFNILHDVVDFTPGGKTQDLLVWFRFQRKTK